MNIKTQVLSVTMQDQDHTNIMHELATLVGSNCNMVQELINDMVGSTDVPTSQSKPPMLEPALHRISKIIMKETVRDNMLELIQSCKKIPENDVDVIDLINTSDLYGKINEGINKHYQRDSAQRITNDMVNITNVSTTTHNNNEATYTGQEEIIDLKVGANNLNKEVRHLQHELRGNMDDDEYVSHDETIPIKNLLEPNNTIGAHIVEGNEDSFNDWIDTYDE